MAENVRWITAAEVADNYEPIGGGGGGSLLTSITPLTNAQILTWPTTPIVVVEATETLNYEGFPTTVARVVAADVIVDASAGAYTNIAAFGVMKLVLGSDWSLTLGVVGVWSSTTGIQTGTFTFDILNNQATKTLYSFTASPDRLSTGGIQDNAIALAYSNSDISGANQGNFTGGNAGNSGLAIVQYVIETT